MGAALQDTAIFPLATPSIASPGNSKHEIPNPKFQIPNKFKIRKGQIRNAEGKPLANRFDFDRAANELRRMEVNYTPANMVARSLLSHEFGGLLNFEFVQLSNLFGIWDFEF